VRRGGWLAGGEESSLHWLQEVLLVAEGRLPTALATAHHYGRVLRTDLGCAGKLRCYDR